MNNTWIGLHDSGDSAVRWVDSRVSYTWLRAFEQIEDIRPLAYLAEFVYEYDVEHPIRNVHYRFRTTPIAKWADDIINQNPSLIFFNCCFYSDGAKTAEFLSNSLAETVTVIRIHHQVAYLAAQPGFREFLLSCDVAIAPTQKQVEEVRKLGFVGPIYALPFGIRAQPMRDAAQPFKKRDIHLASASNSHPARNLPLVEEVYERLRKNGWSVENFVGLPPSALAEKLGRTKVFLQTSMTEASGSRILPEAIAAGCFPVVFDECSTTRELIHEHGTGQSIKTGISFDYRQKKTTYPERIVESLADQIDEIISRMDAATEYKSPPLSGAYDETNEINQLVDILKGSVTQWRKPRPSWRQCMDLPVETGGYAFNPTVLKTPAGLICIYRHVGDDGIRTLRRCMLDDKFGADEFAVWSDEIKALGSDVEWYADPRAFQSGTEHYISFNTGHSESPNEIYLVKIDQDGKPLSGPIKCIKPDGRNQFEKNWGFFCYKNDIYAIYSISPFVILKFTLGDGVAIAEVVASHEWDSSEIECLYGELHGGASPILVDDTGYLIAQSNSDSVDGRIYRGTLLTFEAKPPFRPIAVAPAPLFTLSIDEMNSLHKDRLNPIVSHCFYPTGACYERADLSLSIFYGVNDYRSAHRKYPIERLQKCLTPIIWKSEINEAKIECAILEPTKYLSRIARYIKRFFEMRL